MTRTPSTNQRILAIEPGTRGFGYAVLELEGAFVDWAGKSVKGDKNAGSIAGIEKLIDQYAPGFLVLEDAEHAKSRRSPRIRDLGRQIASLASKRGLRTVLLSRKEVNLVLLGEERGTKQAVAEVLAKRFPSELGSRLPPERRPWESEHYEMDIFDAVALAVTCWSRRRKRSG